MLTISKQADVAGVAPITEILDGWVVTEGNPDMKTWVMHTNEDGSMISGYWEATPGTYYAAYTELSLCT